MDEITIEDPGTAAIPVNLVGVKYEARPPKAVAMITMSHQQAATKSKDPMETLKFLRRFLTSTFGKDQTDAIMERLEDSGDALEIRHVTQLMEALINRAVEGNPTT